jgi:NitT/TauT family transport system permease protein
LFDGGDKKGRASKRLAGRSEGGVGGLLLNQQKYFRLDSVFAIQICILLIGLGQDYAIGLFKRICCPYASLTLERK